MSEAHPSPKVLLIGGPSGSGKSTIARNLANLIGARCTGVNVRRVSVASALKEAVGKLEETFGLPVSDLVKDTAAKDKARPLLWAMSRYLKERDAGIMGKALVSGIVDAQMFAPKGELVVIVDDIRCREEADAVLEAAWKDTLFLLRPGSSESGAEEAAIKGLIEGYWATAAAQRAVPEVETSWWHDAAAEKHYAAAVFNKLQETWNLPLCPNNY